MQLKYILVVSGLPRSGTSLMMQMLERGGIEVVADNVRAADADNPRGYYELERAKKIKQDSSWLPATRGKAFKMVSQLLYDLPSTETYRIIFMERDLDEMITSQEKMLERLGRSAAPREKIKHAYALHLKRLHEWLSRQPNIARLRVNHGDLLGQPELQARRVRDFLGGRTDVGAMVRAVEPSLYRNRTTPAGTGDENGAGTSA
jgi:hypothetical protein